jgi:CheY-like chemotaxis protein
MEYRIGVACREHQIEQPQALKMIHREDERCAAWMYSLYGSIDPWNTSLYDISFPMDKTSPDEISKSILDNISKSVFKIARQSREAVNDFNIAAEVEVVLAQKGHTVGVEVCDRSVTLTINKHVLMLNRLETELKNLAMQVESVKSVETKVGPGYYQPDVYRQYDFEAPSKILLVDDEKKYVKTLSKRLMMRDLKSAVVYDGESALELTREDEHDVMILDLKMPGIDGIEVLRSVKKTNPEMEVIVLTSQGSEADKKICEELGAFAFLSKSVDIDELSRTIKSAKKKIYEKRMK